MSLTLYRLKFHAPLHLGSRRQDTEQSRDVLHSDTLYAAIIQAWAELGKAKEWIPEHENGGALPLGFGLSSLFPYCPNGLGKYSYFFPRPLGMMSPKEYEDNKKLKKVKYLEKKDFLDLLNGKEFDVKKEKEHIAGEYLCSNSAKGEFKAGIMQKKVYPRVYVPRMGESDPDTKIYYIERLFFNEGCGLFFLADFDENDKGKEAKKRLEAALRYLGDTGFGTDKNVGNGLFCFEHENFTFETVKTDKNKGYYTNLSLFCPQADAEEVAKTTNAEKSAYELVKRGGWVTSEPYIGHRKNSVYMFAEGGIFHLENPKTTGALAQAGKTVNLNPKLENGNNVSHPIFRVGQSLFLPVNFPKSKEP